MTKTPLDYPHLNNMILFSSFQKTDKASSTDISQMQTLLKQIPL